MHDAPFSIDNFIHQLSLFSTTSEGVTRFPLTDESQQARDYIVHTMRTIGLVTTVDNVGNVRGRLHGENPNAKALILGSHFDSVRQAGKYDGIAGIACSLAAVKQIIDQKITLPFPLEIIAFEAEEGCDFKSPLIGSKAVAGLLSSDDLKTIYNSDDVDYFTQCVAQSFQPDQLHTQQYNADNTEAYLELHIEQAATLDKKGIPIGIVSAISALYRIRFEFKGHTNHAGATPMNQRQDALVGAAELIHRIPVIIEEFGSEAASITCGRILCSPNRANVIPGAVTLEMDLRDTSDDSIGKLLDGAKLTAEQICQQHNLTFKSTMLGDGKAVIMNSCLQEQLRMSCQRLGIANTDIHSGAGHDAGIFGLIVPTAMIFVPSEKGYSHNPQEFTPLSDLKNGAQIITDFLINYTPVKQKN